MLKRPRPAEPVSVAKSIAFEKKGEGGKNNKSIGFAPRFGSGALLRPHIIIFAPLGKSCGNAARLYIW